MLSENFRFCNRQTAIENFVNGFVNEVFKVKKTSGFSKVVSKGETRVFAVVDGALSSVESNADGDLYRKKTRKERKTQLDQTLAERGVSRGRAANAGTIFDCARAEGTGRIFLSRIQRATLMDHTKRETVTRSEFPWSLVMENRRYLRKHVFKPYGQIVCMRLILFYQKHLSKHTCMYRPTCSQYTLECIHNHGAVLGILLGCCRILRCHPFVKGGTYDPAPEQWRKAKWLV